MGELAGCRGGGGGLSLVVLVSEKPNLVSEKSGKSQGILFICGAGNPVNKKSCFHASIFGGEAGIWACPCF